MRILVDADGCPVKNIIISEAKKRNIPVIMIKNTSHRINSKYAEVITVDKHAESVDLKLINLTVEGDIVVTQDYGVASLALGKKAYCINQNGMVYTNQNIDLLMMQRHVSKKARMNGYRTKGAKKRTQLNDHEFRESFIKLLEKYNED